MRLFDHYLYIHSLIQYFVFVSYFSTYFMCASFCISFSLLHDKYFLLHYVYLFVIILSLYIYDYVCVPIFIWRQIFICISQLTQTLAFIFFYHWMLVNIISDFLIIYLFNFFLIIELWLILHISITYIFNSTKICHRNFSVFRFSLWRIHSSIANTKIKKSDIPILIHQFFFFLKLKKWFRPLICRHFHKRETNESEL